MVAGVGRELDDRARVEARPGRSRSLLAIAAFASAAALSHAQSSGVLPSVPARMPPPTSSSTTWVVTISFSRSRTISWPRRAVAFHAMNLNGSPCAVLAQLAQLAGEPAPPHVVEADLLVQRAADRAHRLAAQRDRAREHLDRDRVREERLDVEQPERVAERERGAVQHLVARGERLDRRRDLDLLAALDGRARPLVELRARAPARMLVDRIRSLRLPWLRNARWSWNGRSAASAPPG